MTALIGWARARARDLGGAAALGGRFVCTFQKADGYVIRVRLRAPTECRRDSRELGKLGRAGRVEVYKLPNFGK